MTEKGNGNGERITHDSSMHRVVVWVKWGALLLAAVVTGSKLMGTDDSLLFTVIALVAFAVALIAQIAEGMLSEYGVRGTAMRGSGILVAVMSLLFLLTLSDPDDRCTAFSQLSGSVTVAVVDSAPIEGEQDGIDDATLEIAKSVHAVLAESFDSDALGDPDLLPRMEAKAQEERAEFASEVALCAKADVVLFLDVKASVGHATIQPRMYVNPDRIFKAQELAGVHALGGPIEMHSNLRNQRAIANDVTPAVRKRIQIVSGFVEALQDYDRGEFALARDRLLAVASAPLWKESDGEEVIMLFVGNAALLVGDNSGARAAFDEALRISEDYGRASLGLGEATFRLSSGRECKEADIKGLNDAIGFFEDAHDALDQPPFAQVQLKANLGIGRAYNCIGIALESPSDFKEALNRLELVTSEYDPNDDNVVSRDVFAVAYAEIGVANWFLGAYDDPCFFFDAAAAYEAAASIDVRPDIGKQSDTWRSAANEARKLADRCPETSSALGHG